MLCFCARQIWRKAELERAHGYHDLGRFRRVDLSCRSDCQASWTQLPKLGLGCGVYRTARASAGVPVSEPAPRQRRTGLKAANTKGVRTSPARSLWQAPGVNRASAAECWVERVLH